MGTNFREVAPIAGLTPEQRAEYNAMIMSRARTALERALERVTAGEQLDGFVLATSFEKDEDFQSISAGEGRLQLGMLDYTTAATVEAGLDAGSLAPALPNRLIVMQESGVDPLRIISIVMKAERLLERLSAEKDEKAATEEAGSVISKMMSGNPIEPGAA